MRQRASLTFDLFVPKMASAENSKAKRRWGKTRNRDKITIVDRMEIEDTLQKFAEEVKSFKERHEAISTPKQNHELDLQQPELMSDFALVEALKKIKVPIPVYADGRPSRERLLYLFRQHVIPRPQRQSRRPGRRRERKVKRIGGQVDPSASSKAKEAEPVAMEVDGTSESGDFWALDSDGSWVVPLKRKRKREPVSTDSAGAPPEKKLLLEPSPAVQTLTSSVADVKAVTKKSSTAVRKIIKLKRPGRTAAPVV